MSGLENSLFQLKFTSKQLSRQAARSGKEAEAEKKRVKRALAQGDTEIAQIYAQNSVRKAQERTSLLRMASRIDAVAARIQTAVTMRSVTKNMAITVRGMDQAMNSMNLEQITKVMAAFEAQFEDLESSTDYYQNVAGDMATTSQPAAEVELLMQQMADEAGVEMKHKMGDAADVASEPPQKEDVKEDALSARLRMLRN